MNKFYHISNGEHTKYLYALDDYINNMEPNDIMNEMQMPVVIKNKEDINIFLQHLSDYSREKKVDIELCNSFPVRIFTKLTNDFLFRFMPILCKSLLNGHCYQNNRDFVYPYRKVYNNPNEINYENDQVNNYSDQYKRNYKKSIFHFRIATFYGYDICIQPRSLNKYINDKIYNNPNYEVQFNEEEELDIKNLERIYKKDAFFSRLISMNPYLPTDKIFMYVNERNFKYIKKLYGIDDKEDVKSVEFFHKLNRYPGLVD